MLKKEENLWLIEAQGVVDFLMELILFPNEIVRIIVKVKEVPYNNKKQKFEMTTCVKNGEGLICIETNKTYERKKDFRMLVTYLCHELGHIYYRDVMYLKSYQEWDSKFLHMLIETRADIFSYYVSSLVFKVNGMSPPCLNDYSWISELGSKFNTYKFGYFTRDERKDIIYNLRYMNKSLLDINIKNINNILRCCYNKRVLSNLLYIINNSGVDKVMICNLKKLVEKSINFSNRTDLEEGISKYMNHILQYKLNEPLKRTRFFCICELLCPDM